MDQSIITYKSSSKLELLILELSIINENYIKYDKKGILYIDNNECINEILNIFKQEKYITDIKDIKNIKDIDDCDIDLSSWRTHPSAHRFDFIRMVNDTFQINWGRNKWLHLPIYDDWKNKTVVTMSYEKFSDNIDFKLYKNIDNDMIFIHFDKNEYIKFIEETGINDVKFYKPESYLDFFKILNSCKLVISNIHYPLSVALAMRKPVITGFTSTKHSDLANDYQLFSYLPQSNNIFYSVTEYINYTDGQLKQELDGIILVISCQKYKNTRLKKYGPKRQIDGWEVINVIGDLFIDKPYIFSDGLLTIKCEDSYAHLLKKLILSLEFIYSKYKLKDGVIKIGDDFIFNHDILTRFLQSKKYNYHGKGYMIPHDFCLSQNYNYVTDSQLDFYMVKYFSDNYQELDNIYNGLQGVNFHDYTIRSKSFASTGGIIYFSNKCCMTLIEWVRKINYDIFYYEEKYNMYPYVIEDCAISFILFMSGYSFNNDNMLWDTDDNPCAMAKHTNDGRM